MSYQTWSEYETHPQFRGMVPMAIGPLSKKLRGRDLIIVVEAPIFRYYPSVPGDSFPKPPELLQITNDPYDAATAIVGDSLLSDAKLALEALNDPASEVAARSCTTTHRTKTSIAAE
jgi:benzoylformate decarboxylase